MAVGAPGCADGPLDPSLCQRVLFVNLVHLMFCALDTLLLPPPKASLLSLLSVAPFQSEFRGERSSLRISWGLLPLLSLTPLCLLVRPGS